MNGSALSEAFYREVVGPIVEREMPGLRYAAARLGSGSDVIGFDDERSRDHDWGCRLTFLVDEADRPALPRLDELLERRLPQSFRGHPVRFATSWSPQPTHEVELKTVMDFAASRLGVDPRHGLSTLDWLILTGHSVLETAGGRVFFDTTSSLALIRQLLEWYPPEISRFALAAGWQKFSQAMPQMGRAEDAGQPLQSTLISARLVTDAMRMAYILERRWAPYTKWFEAGFDRLPIADSLRPHLTAAATATDWRAREAGLVAALHLLAQAQRERGLPAPEEVVTPFWDRPYQTVTGELAASLTAGLPEPLRRLPLVGTIEQWVDNADILARPGNRPALQAAYRAWLEH